jgi:hypothetical protein
MTPSELKMNVESAGHESFFFTRDTMKFFGDTMRNYGVRAAVVNDRPVWELYRKRPVKHGMSDSAYFSQDEFKRVFPK